MTTTNSAPYKKLHDGLFDEIKKLKSQGKNYHEIAEIYQNLGFRKNSGETLLQYDISKFMLKHGYRLRTRKDTAPGVALVSTSLQSVSAGLTPDEQAMADLREIKGSNLSERLKKHLIELYI